MVGTKFQLPPASTHSTAEQIQSVYPGLLQSKQQVEVTVDESWVTPQDGQ